MPRVLPDERHKSRLPGEAEPLAATPKAKARGRAAPELPLGQGPARPPPSGGATLLSPEAGFGAPDVLARMGDLATADGGKTFSLRRAA
jgi:hypothetical protein